MGILSHQRKRIHKGVVGFQKGIAAAIYGTPSLYYSDVFNDGVRLPDEMMKALGKLFAMVARRKWGWPEFLAYGCWRLHDYDADRIVGESYAGRFCWLQTEGGDIEAMGFREQRREICLHGRTLQSIKPEPEDLQVRGDCLEAT